MSSIDNSLSECLTLGKSGIFRDIKGIELAKSVQATSASGNLALNDQFGEEAFSVYDHPEVYIFKKTDDYDPQRVQQILGAADLDKVVRLTPKKADSHPANLMLPDERWQEQKQGGTWSELFNADAPHNRYQVLGVIAWYLSIFILGLVAYPITRLSPRVPSSRCP